MLKYYNTKRFLQCLSKHLSGRSGCGDIEYCCNIEKNKVTFAPNVLIFNSTHSRKDFNKYTVLEHVLKYHFPSIVINIEGDINRVDTSKLIEGFYRYTFSVNRKRRKWIRVD